MKGIIPKPKMEYFHGDGYRKKSINLYATNISNTATTQVKDRTTKLSNSVQISSLVPTRWGRTMLKYQVLSVQKGKTISDLKSMNSMRVEDKSI
ncbi:hypothetical protein H5410_042499 [Solanum commersonii]|uniref:Uncharacterized protein n=1 Tax=Solanum commersonii TaxID=4109 RepID=A0A9J5XUW8_SOLCO|nr:hypothetical protein H5410_042499 [Solanum commersonii]